MKSTLQQENVRVPSERRIDHVRTLSPDHEPRLVWWSAPEKTIWSKQAVRELSAAAHRAEQARAREEKQYRGCSIHLPPHPALLNEVWAIKQLRALPDGRPQRADRMPRLKWRGSSASPQRMERDGNIRRFAGKRRF